jgi:tetratricopeptide (TPR) repeat protein
MPRAGRPPAALRAAAVLALAALAACARTTAPATAGVVVDPPPPWVTPFGDLEILRHRAAMGMTADVRAELAPRLAAAGDAARPDPGRDALRGLAIELALVQGDDQAADRELGRLGRDLGDRADPNERGLLDMLRGTWLFSQKRYDEARSSHLRALAALDAGRAGDPVLRGAALRGLARDQLALGKPEQAVNTLGRAIELHSDAPDARIDLHEDLLLAVDLMIAVAQTDEARIVAGQVYDHAIKQFGPDTLPHAEALLAVAAASLAAGDRTAGESLFADARVIVEALQAARSDPRFPVSARALARVAALQTALGA